MTKDDVRTEAYNQYQFDWARQHGYNINDLINGNTETDEMYACYNEFIDNEYATEKEYIIKLLTEHGGSASNEFIELYNWDYLSLNIRQGDNYILGTPTEIAAYITQNLDEGKFIPCDFAVAETPRCDYEFDKYTLDEIFDSSTGWYGIKELKTDFDNEYMEIYANYYGGGYGQYLEIGDFLTPSEVKEKVAHMIAKLVNDGYKANDTILIGQLQ